MSLTVITVGDREPNSPWDLYHRSTYPVASVQQLGLITTMRLDVARTLVGFEPADPGVPPALDPVPSPTPIAPEGAASSAPPSAGPTPRGPGAPRPADRLRGPGGRRAQQPAAGRAHLVRPASTVVPQRPHRTVRRLQPGPRHGGGILPPRDRPRANLGYTYQGIGNGLKVTKTWPESDVEMVAATVGDYTGAAPFHTCYMTVSGHLRYTFGSNFIARKNRDLVADLPLGEHARAYTATQIELDRAPELLRRKELEAAGVADRTLIAVSADHYPYGLSHGEIVASLDILPTLLNLMDLEYDSRLPDGVDAFSDAPPLVIFNNRSFISDRGRYTPRPASSSRPPAQRSRRTIAPGCRRTSTAGSAARPSCSTTTTTRSPDPADPDGSHASRQGGPDLRRDGRALGRPATRAFTVFEKTDTKEFQEWFSNMIETIVAETK